LFIFSGFSMCGPFARYPRFALLKPRYRGLSPRCCATSPTNRPTERAHCWEGRMRA
jgi:hypothetical protein